METEEDENSMKSTFNPIELSNKPNKNTCCISPIDLSTGGSGYVL